MTPPYDGILLIIINNNLSYYSFYYISKQALMQVAYFPKAAHRLYHLKQEGNA